MRVQKTSAVAVVALVVGVVLLRGLVSAHHGSAVSYDLSKQITLTGTVTEMVWKNPHVFIMFDVTGEQGTIVNWGAETHPPAGMMRNRVADVALPWSSTTLKAGDKVTITVFPSRVGTPRGLLAKVANAEGKVLLDDGASRNRGDRERPTPSQ